MCPECFVKMEINAQKACPVCHRYNNDGGTCLPCKNKLFLDSHLAIMKYEEEKLVGDLIHNFKYNYAEEIFTVFAKIINNYLPQNIGYFADIDFVVPVPLHGRRLAERGFNQAELIAGVVAKLINKEVKNKTIIRHRYTSVQARLKRPDRIKNVSGAFVMNKEMGMNHAPQGCTASILLVDDVFTTGSTLQECAKLLKQNGAKKVLGFTLARG